MRVAIYHSGEDHAIEVGENLKTILTQNEIETDDVNPTVVVTIGGDGTLLSAIQKYMSMVEDVRFVGVHTGHLGFYTDWRDYELEALVKALKSDGGAEVSYPLLNVDVTHTDGSTLNYKAINESTVRKLSGTLVADVLIGDKLFERFRGDGLCISTPTGSTAYNRSVGGAIVHPRLEVLQMAEIASINNRVFRTVGASLIMAPNETITIRPIQNYHRTYNFSADRIDSLDKNVKEVHYSIAAQKVKFLKYRHTGFWNRVRNSFIGDIDEV
jgi:NAD+ kinase